MDNTQASDRWIPWAIVAFFAGFILVLSGFTWLAFHTYTGEVTAGAYQKGLAYNAAIARADAQGKLGWKGVVEVKPEGDNLEVTFRLADASGHAIAGAEVVARLMRPSQAGHDMTFTLVPDGKGAYCGTAKLPWRGLWDMRISATQAGDHYQHSQTVIMP